MEFIKARLHVGGLFPRLFGLNNKGPCALGDITGGLQLGMHDAGYEREERIEGNLECCFRVDPIVFDWSQPISHTPCVS